MTHDELRVDISIVKDMNKLIRKQMKAIDAIFQLHKQKLDDVGRPVCSECTINLSWKHYPCLTIQAIEKELI